MPFRVSPLPATCFPPPLHCFRFTPRRQAAAFSPRLRHYAAAAAISIFAASPDAAADIFRHYAVISPILMPRLPALFAFLRFRLQRCSSRFRYAADYTPLATCLPLAAATPPPLPPATLHFFLLSIFAELSASRHDDASLRM
jgi:hypothetical protein